MFKCSSRKTSHFKLCNAHREGLQYLDHILKPIMQESWYYVKGCGDFLKKIKNIGRIPQGAILVTADVVGLYPSIPHGAGLEASRKRLNERKTHRVPTKELIKLADFLLKNNSFEFNGKVKRQISGTPLVLNLHLFMLVFSWKQ